MVRNRVSEAQRSRGCTKLNPPLVDGQNTTNETSVKAPDEVSIQEQGNGNDGTERCK